MKVDAFCHVLPKPYFDRLQHIASARAANLLKRTAPIRTLWDMDERLRVIEPFEDYAQIISLAAPPLEALGDRPRAPSWHGWPTTRRRSWCASARTTSWGSSRVCP